MAASRCKERAVVLNEGSRRVKVAYSKVNPILAAGLDLTMLKPRPLHEKEAASRIGPKAITMESYRAVICVLFRSDKIQATKYFAQCT